MNQVVLVGYLAREVEVEQHRGGHLVARTLLMVSRGRQGRGPGADFVPIVVRGRAEVLAVAELDAGVRVNAASSGSRRVRTGPIRIRITLAEGEGFEPPVAHRHGCFQERTSFAVFEIGPSVPAAGQSEDSPGAAQRHCP